MKRCRRCNSYVDKTEKYCPSCGYENHKIKNELRAIFSDKELVFWVILGLLVPFGGFLLLGLWYHRDERIAKAAGLGAFMFVLSSFLVPLLLSSFYILTISLLGEIARIIR